MLREALRAAFRRVVHLYFREIEVTGDVPEDGTGGRIFAGNHVNGLVDPVLVVTTAPCPIAPVAKSTLWKIPGLAWVLDVADAVPILRRKDDPTKDVGANEAVFARVAERLGAGGNILIFPEGTSHNEPHLVPLRSGAGRMLATARAAGARGLSFQAVGLEFDARDTFRSRALVVFGPPRAVDAMPEEGEALAQAVTAQLREDLAALVLEGATWEERRLLARVAELLAHEAGDASLARWAAIGQRVAAARAALAHADRALYARIVEAVAEYHALLDEAGTTDAFVARDRAGPPRGRVLRRAGLLAIAPLALVGAALYFVPYQAPRAAARLAKSDADARSTYKIGAGMIAFPVWAAGLVALAAFATRGPTFAVLAAAALVTPFAALAWLDALDRIRARGRFVLVVGRRAAMEPLRAKRSEVLALLADARARTGA